MAVHLELATAVHLAQGSRRSTAAGAAHGASFVDGREKLSDTQRTQLLGVDGCTELNGSQFIRLSHALGESFPDLRGTQVQILKELCLVANCSEEFFLSVSRDQWLRTAIIGREKDPGALFSAEVIGKQCRTLISSITIHSIVVPWDLYWPKLQALRGRADHDVASQRVFFPSTVLEVALSEGKSLVEKLREWEAQEEECAIAKQCHERDELPDEEETSRPFWKIGPDDVEVVNSSFVEGGQAKVWKISWRGGIFARKVFKQKPVFETELEVVRRVSHPHIVYTFGVSISSDKKHYSLLMELLDRDLFALIEDRIRLRGYSKPPFSHLDSLDILLQIARAMAHMHGLPEPVIHGDLKPKNILVSHCEILGDVCQYFVKLADFGSAKILRSKSSSTFNPERGTTQYAAPEVLNSLSGRSSVDDPRKIDIYSFGIVAFQVLTGLEPYKGSPSLRVLKKPYPGVSTREELKKGVMEGTLKPPLQEACSRPSFWNEPALIALVKSCWEFKPSARPLFSEVVAQLEELHRGLIQKQTNGISNVLPPTQANAVNGPQGVSNGSSTVHPPFQANVVDAAPQSLSTIRNGLSLAEVNRVNDASSAPQVRPRNVQDKPKGASRMRMSVSRHLLSWTCISPGKTID